jgi:hypothetical protein
MNDIPPLALTTPRVTHLLSSEQRKLQSQVKNQTRGCQRTYATTGTISDISPTLAAAGVAFIID